jgi:agmatine/peptidylarginine deiminase
MSPSTFMTSWVRHPANSAAHRRDIRGRLEECFPGRDVFIIEMSSSRVAGDSVHCHTNDQPALPTAADSGY